MRSLVVLLVFVLFCLPVCHAWRGGCTSAVLRGSVAVSRVLFSVAGTLGNVLVCTLRAAWLCSVGCICVCTLGSAVLLDFRCACIASINCQTSLSSCSVVVASAPFSACMQCDSARMILSAYVSKGLGMFLCLNCTVSKNLSLFVCLMWHTCVQ